MRGEYNFPAAENFAHINSTKWFGGKTVEKFNKYPSQAVYVQHCVCVCVVFTEKQKGIYIFIIYCLFIQKVDSQHSIIPTKFCIFCLDLHSPHIIFYG